jgi:hypothetical protein
MTTRSETMRRLRLGDLRRYCRACYGYQLPDDDAGREVLFELLLPISLGPEPSRIMSNVIAVQAPWMSQGEAGELIDQVSRMPETARKPTAKVLGERLNVTNADRERLRLCRIRPATLP